MSCLRLTVISVPSLPVKTNSEFCILGSCFFSSARLKGITWPSLLDCQNKARTAWPLISKVSYQLFNVKGRHLRLFTSDLF